MNNSLNTSYAILAPEKQSFTPSPAKRKIKIEKLRAIYSLRS